MYQKLPSVISYVRLFRSKVQNVKIFLTRAKPPSMFNHYYLKIFVSLVLMLILPPAYGKTLSVDNCDHTDINLSPYLELLEDSSNQLDINAVTSSEHNHKFITNTSNIPTFGRTRSTVWSRFQLESKTNTTCFLHLNHPIGGDINTYVNTGNHTKYLSSLEGTRLPTYELKLSANVINTVYIQANNGKERLTLPFKLLSSENLLKKNKTETLIFSALVAGMFILVLYNLLMFVSLREETSLVLISFITFCIWLFLHDSHLFRKVSFLTDSNQYFYTLPLLLGIASALHFWSFVCRGGNIVLEQICKWVPLLSICIAPFIGLLFLADFYIYAILLALDPVLFFLLAWDYAHGHKNTRDNFIAAAILLIAIIPYLMMQIGLLEYTIIYTYIAQTGLLIALLLLSFAQAEQTRRLREENHRIEATSKSKDIFLATMSHELRTPVHAITGLTKLLDGTPKSVEQENYLKKLSASAQHMQTLIDDILDLSKIEADRLDITPANFNLNEEVEKIRQIFSWSIKQKNITFYIHKPDQELDLYGDATRLNQILANLLSNAVKFTEKGDISLIVQQQDCDKENHIRIHFDVIDTGIGISPDMQKHLFQPFFQSENSYSRRYGGTGLGLSISQKLVNIMGGELKVKSKLNKGSQFFFTLDFMLANIPQPVSKNLTVDFDQLKDKGFHILIVDDDEINLFLAQQMLEKLGIRSSTTNGGKQALQLLADNQHFDLIMMDVSMPEMDGYTTCKLIRQQGYSQLPIIAVTAHAIKTEYEKSRQAGMDAYLTKPFTLEKLYEVLLAFLGEKQPVQKD